MAERITPEATRRGGVEACLVRLADGAEWSFPRPTVRLTPQFVRELDGFGNPIERVGVRRHVGYPHEIAALIDELIDACGRSAVMNQYEAFFNLAVSLLRRAHDIDFNDACRLLDVAESDFPRLVSEVLAATTSRPVE